LVINGIPIKEEQLDWNNFNYDEFGLANLPIRRHPLPLFPPPAVLP
jgi:hypothetical protein